MIFAALAALGVLALAGSDGGTAAAEHGLSAASLHGAYAGLFSGESESGGEWVPVHGTGVFITDGRGRLSGRETYMVGRRKCEATISGTYTVAPDGTGTDEITYTPTPASSKCSAGSFTQSFAIARHGELVLLVNTNPGNQIEAEWHRQR